DGAAMKGARAVPFEGFFQEIGRFFLTLWRAFKWTPRRPWDWRELPRQVLRIGVGSAPVVLLTPLFTGAVMALPAYTALVRCDAEGVVASIVALAMVRELACVIGGLIIVGRSGAAVAAELGAMRVTEQIDALEALATAPIHYLMVPRVWATTITAPL